MENQQIQTKKSYPYTPARLIPHLGIDSPNKLNRHKIIWDRCAKKSQANYEYTKVNIPIIVNLIMYINGQTNNFDKYNIPGIDFAPNKGIMLAGNVGVGKSLLFDILHRYCYVTNNPNSFRIESIESLKIHYKKHNNMDYFNQYHKGINRRGINLCINEFGYDCNDHNYGVKFSETFKSFIMQRYELFESHGLITHATTNMNAIELRDNFDPPAYDRIKQMFNLIPVEGESYRK